MTGCSAVGCDRKSRNKHKGIDVCGMHYQRLRTHGSFDNPPRSKKIWGTCTVEACENDSRTRSGALCEMHYARRYRTGSLDVDTRPKLTKTSQGYLVRHIHDHPVSGKNGRAYEHRRVLFDKIGVGDHKCHWCLNPIIWHGTGKQRLVVDHLDNDKENNSENNLVPSCHGCNATRGLFMSWVHSHKDDPFLLRLFNAANDN